jgi:calcium-binding protein CML
MEAFRMFDTDGHGCITARVLEGILGGGPHACSLDDCRRMIGGVDADGFTSHKYMTQRVTYID